MTFYTNVKFSNHEISILKQTKCILSQLQEEGICPFVVDDYCDIVSELNHLIDGDILLKIHN